jgi:hypothetical protein
MTSTTDLDALHRMDWGRFPSEESAFFKKAGARVEKELGEYGFSVERCTHVRMVRQKPTIYLTFFMSPMVVLKSQIIRSGVQLYVRDKKVVIPGGAIGHSNESSSSYNYKEARFYERSARSDQILTDIDQGLLRAGNLVDRVPPGTHLPDWAGDWSGGLEAKAGLVVIKVLESSREERRHTLLASPFDNEDDQLVIHFDPETGDVDSVTYWELDAALE